MIKSQELTIMGMILFISFVFIFAGGYFLGKKHALEELALHYEDECFADKIQQSLSLLQDQQEQESDASELTQ